MQIVPATTADFSTITSIAQRTWPSTFAEILSPEQIAYMLDMMYSEAALQEQVSKKGHRFLLLKEEEEAVAYASYEIDYLPGKAKIHKLYCLPETQGKGYGKALIFAVADLARQDRQQRLRLDVNYQNKAVGFYHYLGFETVDRIDTNIGNGYLMEDYVMEMEL